MAVPLGDALEVLAPDARPQTDYEVRDDGAGPYLAAWSLPAPQPTPEEIAAVTPEQVQAVRVGRLIALAGAMLDSTDPIPQAVRVLERVQQDHSNEQWRRVAACLVELAAAAGHTLAAELPEPLLEPEMFSRLVAYLQSGLSLPGPRPDVP